MTRENAEEHFLSGNSTIFCDTNGKEDLSAEHEERFPHPEDRFQYEFHIRTWTYETLILT